MIVQPTIRQVDASDPGEWFDTMAMLHAEHIHHGVLPLLGRPFLTRLYRELASVPSAGVWIALDQERIAGYIAGTFDDRTTYKQVLRRAALPLIRLSLPSMGRVLWRTVASSVRYIRRRGRTTDAGPGAELLAIAVDPHQQRSGAGSALVTAFEDALIRRSVTSYSVTTNAVEEVSNAFYRARGFVLTGTMPHHSLILNVYVKRLTA